MQSFSSNAYGLIEDKQEEGTGTRPDLSFSGMDWASLARAFGWGHTACETADDLADTLTGPCDDRPARQLITVPVKYSGTFA
ncbi:hypothetical protein KUV65_02410 [Maritalea mobilis]|uniref:hypothetical protein n=1 Tax=Maritalea mobilis TaxID=483324 RepID=UPI001C96EECB|nr:hypothetical protein [Maritalea mobilis]MBY6200199.1 hypothetical protein [Maritalea mobilis]